VTIGRIGGQGKVLNADSTKNSKKKTAAHKREKENSGGEAEGILPSIQHQRISKRSDPALLHKKNEIETRCEESLGTHENTLDPHQPSDEQGDVRK